MHARLESCRALGAVRREGLKEQQKAAKAAAWISALHQTCIDTIWLFKSFLLLPLQIKAEGNCLHHEYRHLVRPANRLRARLQQQHQQRPTPVTTTACQPLPLPLH